MAKIKKRRKHIFFLPLMLIGMGVGFLLSKLCENAFLACMFIGMGLGFFLDSLFVVEERKIKIKKAYKVSSFALIFLGIIFILVGVIYLINPSLSKLLWDYLIALGFIAFGLLIFVKGVERFK